MIKLQFNSTEEFETLFRSKTLSVTRGIIQGVEQAMQSNKRSANLFQIEFTGAEDMYEITLPQNQWTKALESCLEHLQTLGSPDEQIDCWKLLEAAKAW